MPNLNPDIPAAVKAIDHAHSYCRLMRSLLEGRVDNISRDMLGGLTQAFETVAYNLEVALDALEQER
jgi:hypothetical protein